MSSPMKKLSAKSKWKRTESYSLLKKSKRNPVDTVVEQNIKEDSITDIAVEQGVEENGIDENTIRYNPE